MMEAIEEAKNSILPLEVILVSPRRLKEQFCILTNMMSVERIL